MGAVTSLVSLQCLCCCMLSNNLMVIDFSASTAVLHLAVQLTVDPTGLCGDTAPVLLYTPS